MVGTRGLASAKSIVKKQKQKPNGSKESKRRVEESANANVAPVARGRKKRAYSSSEEEESPSPVVSMQKKKQRMAEEPKGKRSRKQPSKSVGGISYKWHSEELFFGRINQNSRLQYLALIENSLSQTDWQTVMQGPFGPCIKIMKNLKFSAQLIHHVLFRQLDTKKQFETWYDLGGQPCRFSMEEFRLITGLNCGMPDEEDSKQDKNAVFEFFGVRSITIANLLNKFLAYREDNVYKMKMALLLILEGVVLGGDKKRKVRPFHVKLTEDLDRFNNFPWGRSAYLDLHQSLASSLDTRMESVQAALAVSDNARAGYTIRGFPMVFQIWLYEAVPHIGRTFAQKLNNDVHPRGVRWLKCSRPSLDEISASLEGKFPAQQILVEEDGDDLGESCYFPEEEGHKTLDEIVKQLKPRRKTAGKKSKGVGKGGQAGNIEGFDPRQMMCALNELHEMMHALREDFIELNKFIRGKAPRTGASSSRDQDTSTQQELCGEVKSDNEPNIFQHQQSMREAKTESEANDDDEKVESEEDEDNDSNEGESEDTETDEETLDGEPNTGEIVVSDAVNVGGQKEAGNVGGPKDAGEEQGDATDPLSVLVQTCSILHADEKLVNEATAQEAEGLINEYLLNDEFVNDGTGVATEVEVGIDAVSDEGVHDGVVEVVKEAVVKGGSKVDEGGVHVEEVAKGGDVEGSKRDDGGMDVEEVAEVADVEGRTKVDDQVVEELKGDVEGENTVTEGVMEEATGDVVEGGTKLDELGVEARTEVQGEKVSQADSEDVGGDEGETKESKVPRKGRPRKASQVPKKTYPSRTREVSAKAKSPYRNVDEQKLAKKITKNSKVEGMTELVKWMQSESIEPRAGPAGQALDKEFFEDLFAPKKWLDGQHMEQMMFLYRQRISEDPERFSKVVVLEPFWQNYVQREFERFHDNEPRKGKDEMLSYMKGSHPGEYGKRWDDAERIYACFNIPRKHWFAVEIDLCDWCVTVYDSTVDLYKDKDIFEMIRPIAETVPRYVKMYEPLAKRCEALLDNPMSVSRRHNLKQNKRGGDCGVYTLKYIELLILGMTNLDLASDKFIDAHRSHMAHSIFRCCWDGF